MPIVPLRAAAVLLSLSLIFAVAASAGAKPAVRGGVIHACLVTKGGKGAARGTLRIVPGPHSCKARRGERAVAWNLRGPTGAPGAADAAESARPLQLLLGAARGARGATRRAA